MLSSGSSCIILNGWLYHTHTHAKRGHAHLITLSAVTVRVTFDPGLQQPSPPHQPNWPLKDPLLKLYTHMWPLVLMTALAVIREMEEQGEGEGLLWMSKHKSRRTLSGLVKNSAHLALRNDPNMISSWCNIASRLSVVFAASDGNRSNTACCDMWESLKTRGEPEYSCLWSLEGFRI